MPIVDKYKDMGTVLMGKVESGECKKGQTMLIMPNRVSNWNIINGICNIEWGCEFTLVEYKY